MSQAVTDITPRDMARVTQASTSNMSQGRGSLAYSLLCPEPGSYGNTGPHPQLPCLAQGSTVSLQLVLDTPVPSRKIYSLTLPSQMIQSGVPTRNLFSD